MLVECMVYIALVMIILGLGLNLFLKLLSFHRDLERNSHDIARSTKAGEIWRDDIRSASAAIQIENSADELRLTIPMGDESIEYRYRDGVLWRQATEERPSQSPFLKNLVSCEFVHESRPHAETWTWEVQLKTKKKVVHIEPRFSFLAVPTQLETRHEN